LSHFAVSNDNQYCHIALHDLLLQTIYMLLASKGVDLHFQNVQLYSLLFVNKVTYILDERSTTRNLSTKLYYTCKWHCYASAGRYVAKDIIFLLISAPRLGVYYYVAARQHIFVCFMAKSAFWRGFSALAPYTGVGPI